MWIFTDGVETVRVLPRTGGCEVRHGAVILIGNADLATLLAHLYDDPQAATPELLAARVAVPAATIRARVQEALDTMADRGIPRSVWGPWSLPPGALPALSSPTTVEERL